MWQVEPPHTGVVSTASLKLPCIVAATRALSRIASRSCGSHHDHSHSTCSRFSVVPEVAMISTRPFCIASFRSHDLRTSDLGKPRRRSRLAIVGSDASQADTAAPIARLGRRRTAGVERHLLDHARGFVAHARPMLGRVLRGRQYFHSCGCNHRRKSNMGRMGPAILIAHGNAGDHIHDRAFALAGATPRVAWIGAANGDSRTWFERAAKVLREKYGATVELARTVGVDDGGEARRVIEGASMIYVAGGDVGLLAERLSALGLDELVRRRHADGALVVGVSAGAIGLTRYWVRFADDGADDDADDAPPSPETMPTRFPCIGALPFAVDCHDEESDWEELRALLDAWGREEPGAAVDAFGIPSGGALEVAPDGRITHLGPAPKRLRLDGGRIVE